jgi:hypothetical protein
VVRLAVELDDELPLRPVHVDGESCYDDVELRLGEAGLLDQLPEIPFELGACVGGAAVGFQDVP